MANKKITRRAVVMSVISLILCCAMLVGTTFAWFTDSVTSSNNIIQSGNLDIELEYYDGNDDAGEAIWKTVNGESQLFSEEQWEPGHTQVVYLKLSNLGSLALKYQLGINIASETAGINVMGDEFKLSNYIYMGVVEDVTPSTYVAREDAIAAAKAGANGLIGAGYTKSGVMENDQDKELYLAVVVYMPETVGNEANHNGETAPAINLGLNVVATQHTVEEDSFGSNYDENAAFPNLVSTAADLAEALKNGKNVVMAEDITAPLNNLAIYKTPVAVIQKGGVFDGNGYSLDIENPDYNGYAIETYGGTIKNLTIDTAVGRGIVISSPTEDIYIDNVIVDGPGYAINTTEHNGKNLYITNSTVKGWTSLAGLNSVSFTNCSLGENSEKYWQNIGYEQDYDRLVRPYVTSVFTNCAFEQSYYIDLSALGADCSVTLDNCTVNGTKVTANNYSSLITIELPSGRTVADCVIFK